MAADVHLGMMALSRVTLASAGLSCFKARPKDLYTPPTRLNSTVESRRRRRCVLGLRYSIGFRSGPVQQNIILSLLYVRQTVMLLLLVLLLRALEFIILHLMSIHFLFTKLSEYTAMLLHHAIHLRSVFVLSFSLLLFISAAKLLIKRGARGCQYFLRQRSPSCCVMSLAESCAVSKPEKKLRLRLRVCLRICLSGNNLVNIINSRNSEPLLLRNAERCWLVVRLVAGYVYVC